jgi:RND family efflux transporter MFP subunit
MKYGILLSLAVALLAACSRKEGAKETTESAGHGPVQITAWSGTTEVFLEHPELEPGKAATLLLYLTRLADWQPLEASAVQLVITPPSGPPLTVAAKATKPGVYRAEATFPAKGAYGVTLVVGDPQGERLVLPTLQVGEEHDHHADDHKETASAEHKDEKTSGHDDHDAEEKKKEKDGHAHDDHGEHGHGHEHAEEHAGHEDHAGHADEHEQGKETGVHAHASSGAVGTITLTKEQQWAVTFGVAEPKRMDMASGITAVGELVPVATAEAVVAAPLAGVVSPSRPLPFPGKRVAKGEVIAVIDPPATPAGGMTQLTAEHAQATSRLTLAQAEYDRAKRLVEGKIAARKRLEEAQAALEAARAAVAPLDAAMRSVQGGNGGRITVRAPVAGTVVEVSAVNGSGVVPGQTLVRIVDTGRLWLKVSLPAADLGKAMRPAASGTTFTVAGLPGEFRAGGLVSDGAVVDPQTRTLPVIFAVENRDGRLKAGMFARVTIRTGMVKAVLAVPKDALFEDEARWFAFVQISGITFDRREVQIGAEDRGMVQILSGLGEHDRAVVKGGYYVKLASQGGATADPHAGHGH